MMAAPAGGMNLSDSVYERLMRERIMFLGSAVMDENANQLAAQMLLLAAEEPGQDIHLYINSPGGSVTATFALYDTMQFCRVPVSTTCVGQAFSCTALLLAAGEPGQRLVLPHARVLLHQPSGQGRGTIPDLILAADEILLVREEMERALSHHTGQDIDRLRHDTDRDRIFRAEEAVSYGLADQVISSR